MPLFSFASKGILAIFLFFIFAQGVRLTFIAWDLDVSEQADLNDLPEEPEYQMRSPRNHVLSIDIDHRTTDGWGGVKGQYQILLEDKKDIRVCSYVKNARVLCMPFERILRAFNEKWCKQKAWEIQTAALFSLI